MFLHSHKHDFIYWKCKDIDCGHVGKHEKSHNDINSMKHEITTSEY